MSPASPLYALQRNQNARARQRPEYIEQSGVVKLYQSINASVYVRSVYGAHPKGVTPGQPDLCIKQPDWRLTWEQEVKPAGKRQSKPQYDYMREAQQMGAVYVLGGVFEAMELLDFLGIVAERLPDSVQFLHPREVWGIAIERKWPSRMHLGSAWYASREWAAMFDRYGYKT